MHTCREEETGPLVLRIGSWRVYMSLFLCLCILHIIQLTPQKLSPEHEKSPGAEGANVLPRRPEEALKEKTGRCRYRVFFCFVFVAARVRPGRPHLGKAGRQARILQGVLCLHWFLCVCESFILYNSHLLLLCVCSCLLTTRTTASRRAKPSSTPTSRSTMFTMVCVCVCESFITYHSHLLCVCVAARVRPGRPHTGKAGRQARLLQGVP